MTTPEQPPEWAMKRAVVALNNEMNHNGLKVAGIYGPALQALARLIAKHEQPPVDPILAAAREAVARRNEKRNFREFAESTRSGGNDDHGEVKNAVEAITLSLEREADK